jgi:hypothetical protein
VRLGLVVAGLLAARRADAGHRGAHGRAGAAQVEAQSLSSSKAFCTLSVLAPWNMMSPDWPWKAIRPEPCFSQMSHILRSTSVL